jgi:signal transduction histidine kinase
MESKIHNTQEEKLIMLGGMFENIIHQFKQPLNAINAEATGLKFQKEIGVMDDETFEQSLDNIINRTLYLAETIDDFRDFLKEDKVKFIFKISDNLKQIESIIEPLLKAKGIKIFATFTNKDVECYGYGREFAQVVINILNNAKDAILMNDVEEKVIKVDVIDEGKNIKIDIYDNAGGISEDILPRIFNPHFTTKEENGGTGIGLTMSKNIIEEHFKGSLLAKNTQFELNEKSYYGACFTIIIPKNMENV